MKKRYAVVGVSHRAPTLFINPILGPYADVAELAAFVDLSEERMRNMNELKKTATYSLNGSVPFEGFRLGINGLDGRLEYESLDPRQGQPMPEPPREDITLIKLFGERQTIRPVAIRELLEG